MKHTYHGDIPQCFIVLPGRLLLIFKTFLCLNEDCLTLISLTLTETLVFFRTSRLLKVYSTYLLLFPIWKSKTGNTIEPFYMHTLLAPTVKTRNIGARPFYNLHPAIY